MKKCNIKGLCERAKDKAKEYYGKVKRMEIPIPVIIIVAVSSYAAFLIPNWEQYLQLKETLKVRGVIEITILFALVLVTYIYAKLTARIASETREQRMAMDRPRIIFIIQNRVRGDNFAKEIGVDAINVGRAPAINTNYYIVHPRFEFNKPLPNCIIFVDDKDHHDFKIVETRIDKDPRINIKSDALVLGAYEDVYQDLWYSTLELYWDDKKKDITTGRREVATRKISKSLLTAVGEDLLRNFLNKKGTK